jgi:hypothetical protein
VRFTVPLPAGTVAVILESLSIAKLEAVGPKSTAVAPVNADPLIETE